MAYERIDWENEPSVNTPINEDNLNHMEDGIVQNETDIAGKMDANNPTGTGCLKVTTANSSKATGNPSYSLGYDAQSEGDNSFAFGSTTRAKAQGAYAMGSHAEANKAFSHSIGTDTIADSMYQTARGRRNEIDSDGVYADILGGGDLYVRKNIETTTWNGDKWVAGDYTNGNGETLHGAYQAFIDGLPVDSESGNPCVITDAFGGSVKALSVTFEPIQSGSGTPSPSNVRPISGRTEVNVTVADAEIDPTQTQTYTIDLDGTRYGGTVDFKTGVLTVTHQYKNAKNFSGNWVRSSNFPGSFFINAMNNGFKQFTPFLCTHAQYVSSIQDLVFGTCYCDNDINIRILDESSTLTDWTTYINNNDVIVCGELATPTTVQLTTEEVTLLRLNNVLTTNGSDISVSYSADVQAYIDKKIAEGSASRSVNTSLLTKGGSSESTEEETEEIKEEVKETKEEK